VKPSERIQQLADEICPLMKGSALETSEAELRLCCVITYLDEQAAASEPPKASNSYNLSDPDDRNAFAVDILSGIAAIPAAPASSPAEDPRGTSACPVCDRSEPHAHARLDIEKWVNNRISSWGFFSRVFHKPNKATLVRDARWRIQGELHWIHPTTNGEWGWVRDGMVCAASEAEFLENNEFEWVDNPGSRVFDAPKAAPAPSPGDDRRVSRELYESVVDQRDEARAELTQTMAVLAAVRSGNARLKSDNEEKLAAADRYIAGLKEENARLSGELAETQTLLIAATNQRDEAQRTIAHEREQANQWLVDKHDLEQALAWERGWDLLRKAQMGAVVDAARAIDARYWRPKDEDIIRPLRVALAALDAPSQPEPASEPDATVRAGR